MRPGEAIAGRYELLRSVRTGGLSVVFEAVDRRTGQRVAVKVINVQPREEALLRRIEREIKILSSLAHPHVVACLGSGALPDGRPYLVLEWLEGEDLADFKLKAPMTLRQVLEVTGQVADALSAGHMLGIIHRDVKPANIYLVRPGASPRLDCRVIDFGVAKMPQANAAITRAGAILGTPSYMAPEQATFAMDVDARADVFSLGVVAYELLLGRLPWQSTTDLARLARVTLETAIPVLEVNAEVPPAVAALIDKMLALKATERPASARVVHDLALAALKELPEPVLDTTFTRDPEQLSQFVREPTADLSPLPQAGRRSGSSAELFTEGLDLGPGGLEGALLPVVGGRAPETSGIRSALQRERRSTPERGRGRGRGRGERGAPAVPEQEATQVLAEPSARRSSGLEQDTPRQPLLQAEVEQARTELALEPVGRDRPPSAETVSAAEAPRAPAPRPVKVMTEGLSYVEPAPSTLLFGRVQEIEALRSAVMRALNAERPSLTLVTGPAGVGKTRVRVELVRVLRGGVRPPVIMAGRAEETARVSPFGYLRRLLLLELGLGRAASPAEQRQRVLELFPTGVELEALLRGAEPRLSAPVERRSSGAPAGWSEHPSMIAALEDAFSEALDQDEERSFIAAMLAEALRLRAFEHPRITALKSDPVRFGAHVCRALDVALRARGGKNGLALLVDDAHLVDPMSALVLRRLADARREQRVAVVGFALPAILDPTGPHRSPLAAPESKTVELQPLDARASREFVRSLVKGPVDSNALEQIVRRVNGNPLFLEQLVRAVLANGTLRLNEGGEYGLAGLRGDETDDDRVPPTVAAAVAARIGRMRPDQQKLLPAAAVFGEIFWVEGLACLLGQGEEETLATLDSLVLEGVVRPRARSRYDGQTEMEFCHAAQKSVALSRLKRRRRHKLEEAALTWLRGVGEAEAATMAAHEANAGAIDTAARLYADAAEESLLLGSMETAGALADEGLLLVEGAGILETTRRRLLDVAERVAVAGADFGAAGQALDALQAIARSAADHVQVLLGRAEVAQLDRRFKEAEELARRALEQAREAGLGLLLVKAALAQAEAFEALGDLRAALKGYLTALAGQTAPEPAEHARAARGLARIALSSGDYRTAESRFKEALSLAEAAADQGGGFAARLGLAEAARLVGELERAESLVAQAEAQGVDLAGRLLVNAARARLFAETEHFAEARVALDAMYLETDGQPALQSLRRVLASYRGQLLGLGGAEGGLEALEDRLARAVLGARTEDPPLLPSLLGSLGLCRAALGRLPEARAAVEEGVERFREEGALADDEPPRIFWALARVLEAAGAERGSVRAAWKSAVDHLDSIASRLDRKVRRSYLSRPLARAIVRAATEAGLAVVTEPSSHRIHVQEVG